MLLVGDENRKGLCQEVGCMSWKNARLKNSAVLALSVLAHLLDPKRNAPDAAAALVVVFTRQAPALFEEMSLPSHLRSSRGDKASACFLLALLKRDNFAAARALVTDELPDDIRAIMASTLPAAANGTYTAPVAQLAELCMSAVYICGGSCAC